MSMHLKPTIAAALLLAASIGNAQTPAAQPSLAALSTDADLVFQGTVANIEYATSIEGIPHTFVTYRVEDVVKGAYSAPTLTLRFIGGVKVEGKVLRKLSVSHAPTFEVGQQDLMMVRGNSRSQCPLVRCAQGRFRFQQGMVMSEEGDVVAMDPGGSIVTLPAQAESAGAGDFGAGSAAAAPVDSRATPMDRASFVAQVRQLVAQQSPRQLGVVASADPSRPFQGPSPAVAAPPRSKSPQRFAVSGPQSEHDRQEVEALLRNDGNPVLSTQDEATLRRLAVPPTADTPR